MLAFISDLHLSDETAIAGSVAPDAIELALRGIYGLAGRIARARDRPTDVTLVLLGDIFDLLRTERWFQDRDGAAVPLAERPWASPDALTPDGQNPRALLRARAIVDEIVDKNGPALAALRGETVELPEGVTVRRVYVPGNHDRLYLHDEGLRARMRAALGAVDGPGTGEAGFGLHHLELPAYGLVARHGHEWDMWSFPGYHGRAPADFAPEAYLPTPIGDVVTTEMTARLPFELERRLLDSRAFGPEGARRIHDLMKRIDDVRPLFASFRWAYDAVDHLGADLGGAGARVLRGALDDALRSMARELHAMPFYEAWRASRLFSWHPLAAVILELALRGMSCLRSPSLGAVSRLVDTVLWRHHPADAARRGAGQEDLGRVGRTDMRFVVYGHTHRPAQIPIRGDALTQDVYLNTGTYRPGLFRADGPGFVGWYRLAFVCVASAEEALVEPPVFGRRRGGPAFVAWTGARSHGAPALGAELVAHPGPR